MKSKEHTKQLRDEVVEKFKAGLGYKKISQALNISWSTVKSIIKKWKENGTTANLPRHGRPSKLTGRTRRALIRDAVKRPTMSLIELQKSAAQAREFVSRTTISRTLHKSGIREKGRNLCKLASKKKSKAKVHVKKLERPISAMFIFSKEKRPKLLEEQPDLTDRELTCLLARMWDELQDEEKEKYKQLEAVQKAESEKKKNVDRSRLLYPPKTGLDFWQQLVGDYLARSSESQDSEEEEEDDDNEDEDQNGSSDADSCSDADDKFNKDNNDNGNDDIKNIAE